MARGSRGGALFPLASQLNDDMTHLQGQQLKGMVGEILEVLARLDGTRTAAPTALAQLPPETTGFTAGTPSWRCWPGGWTPTRRGGRRWPGWPE